MDAMAGYDAWKTTDREGERRQAEAEFRAENTRYSMGCCGTEIDADDVTDGRATCPTCKDEAGQPITETVTEEVDEPPTREDFAPEWDDE